MAVLDVVVEGVEADGVVGFEDGLVGVEEFEDALCCGVGFLQVVVDAHDRLYGWDEASEEDDEEDEDGGEQFAPQDGHAAEDEDEDEAEGDEHFGEGAAEFATLCDAYHGAGVGVVGFGEMLFAFLFAAEGTDGAEACQRLFEYGEEVS